MAAALNTEKSKEELLKLLEETEYRLEEANDTLDAIKSGEIDALILKGDDGHSIFTLKSADHSFRIFIEQMSEGAVTLNKEGLILYTNSSFASIIDLPLEKIIAHPFDRFILPMDLLKWNEIMFNAWNNQTKVELELFSTNGSIVPVLLSLKKLELSDGLSLSVIITDLSAQKDTERLLQKKNEQLEEAQRTANYLNATLENTVAERTKALTITIAEKVAVEQSLRSNQERLSQILETMAEGVIIKDLDYKLAYANPMAQKIMGIVESESNENEYIDSNWEFQWVNGEKLPLEHYPVWKAMRSGKPVYDYEISIQPPEGERFYISVNAAPIKDAEGNIIAGIGTFMDVTNRRKAIQQKDDFISVASHELRTPVTSLKASLQLMERLKDRSNAIVMIPKLISQANKSMNKMSVLIEDLLNATKMTEGQLHLKKSWFNMHDLIHDCCHDVLSDGTFKLTVSGELEAAVFADEHKVEQVIVNFISNAAKYAPNSKEIKVLIEKKETYTKVSVIDQGPGIPTEKLPYIFDRYYRVDSSGVQYSGLGLGLYICSQIIYKHGGQIGADSKIGQGSSFWFTIPNLS
ncbi:PAS domain-containing sensor histidine kinase [Pedobacter metabolipauper]|uniref:histidine kinase n=1 Tax=Pedobacter metabolipauper TaxID=425513 RepID=A0A4R6SU65_9SPHI|nr:ATP-binding protein [Pedobacter metabolipauper]TDQ08558.1 two-component system CheB/CheR fusion protein [Pedobacter metabolipauper]